MTATVTVRPQPPRRKRHWLRWTLASLAAFVVLLLAAVAVAVKVQPVPAPLALPATAQPPSGPLDGAWQVASGSIAGFRIRQTVLGLTSDVVGRTEGVTGIATLADGRVTAARLSIDLLTLTSGGKPAPQFGISLDTEHHPQATVTLTQPVALGEEFGAGPRTTATATATLTLHGVTRDVSVPLTACRDGAVIRIAGSLPVAFADYQITGPDGYGKLGSLANHGIAEFLIVLTRG